MGAATIITVALITLGIYEYNNAKRLSDAVNGQINSMSAQIGSEELLKYDRIKVRGSDVYDFAKRFLYDNRLGISMKVDGVCYSDYTQAQSLMDEDSAVFVDPLAVYSAAVEINENRVVTAVSFSRAVKTEVTRQGP